MHYVNVTPQLLFDPCNERPPVMTVSPEQPQTGKEILEWLKQLLGSGQVGLTGSRDFDFHKIAFGIDQGVSFASPDFFSPYQCLSLDLARHWF
jgi:hypothetical protein